MAERPSPKFFRLSPLDQTSLTAMANRDHTQYLKTIKLALVQYMKAYLMPGGQFRKFADNLASYTIGYTINEELSGDPNERGLQIAAYYDDMREQLPQIFIQDNGYEYKSDSLGSLAAGWNMLTRDGHQAIRVLDAIEVPIDIHLVALSIQEVEDLISFMHIAFGQSQRLTVNYYLEPESPQQGVYWVVRLPLQHSISAKTHTPLHGSARQQIWQATCSLTVNFENSVFLQYRSQPQYTSKRGDPGLTFPSTIPLGQERAVSLLNYPEPITVYSDDNRIAVVQQSRREWIVYPRRVGTFNLIVKSTKPTQSSNANILLQQSVEVRAR